MGQGVEGVQKKHRTSAEPTLTSIDLPLLHIKRALLVGDDIWELPAVDVFILLRAAAALDWSGAYLALAWLRA